MRNIETREAAQVLADELEERGDSRAGFARAQLAGEERPELLADHWDEWVGSLAPKATLVRWRWGHIVELAVSEPPSGWTPGELVRKPAAEFLSRLALGPAAASVGLQHASALRQLVCFGPLRSWHLPAVEQLVLDLDRATIGGLPALDAPRLRLLDTRVADADELQLFDALGRAPWFAGVQRWTHRLASADNLAALVAILQAAPARLGEGLMLLCQQPVLDRVAERLGRELPGAAAKLLPAPQQRLEPGDFHRVAGTGVTPLFAPVTFRALVSIQQSARPSPQSSEDVVTRVGHGVDLGKHLFQNCGWCGSSNTHGIFHRTWSLYSHFETTKYDDWEYECRDCGVFTAMRRGATY